jgi:hypothetical protein
MIQFFSVFAAVRRLFLASLRALRDKRSAIVAWYLRSFASSASILVSR